MNTSGPGSPPSLSTATTVARLFYWMATGCSLPRNAPKVSGKWNNFRVQRDHYLTLCLNEMELMLYTLLLIFGRRDGRFRNLTRQFQFFNVSFRGSAGFNRLSRRLPLK